MLFSCGKNFHAQSDIFLKVASPVTVPMLHLGRGPFLGVLPCRRLSVADLAEAPNPLPRK